MKMSPTLSIFWHLSPAKRKVLFLHCTGLDWQPREKNVSYWFREGLNRHLHVFQTADSENQFPPEKPGKLGVLSHLLKPLVEWTDSGNGTDRPFTPGLTWWELLLNTGKSSETKGLTSLQRGKMVTWEAILNAARANQAWTRSQDTWDFIQLGLVAAQGSWTGYPHSRSPSLFYELKSLN